MTTDQVKNRIIATPESEQKTLKDIIKGATTEIGKALPAHMTPERVIRIALTTIAQNPDLAKCTPNSFMGSLFAMAQLGLEPIGGRCYLLPFNNKRNIGGEWKVVKEVQLLVGYKGYIELFYRHDAALSIDMRTVHANDDFSFEYGTGSFLKHRPAIANRGEVVAYYAVAKLRGGASIFQVMSKDDCMDHGRKHSKTYDSKTNTFYSSSPWAKEPDAMCCKTVLLQLAKLLPLSIELQRAISMDETSRDYRSGVEDAIELPNTTNWDEKPSTAESTTTTPEEQWAKEDAQKASK